MRKHCQAPGAAEVLGCSFHVHHAHEKHRSLVRCKLGDPGGVGWEEEPRVSTLLMISFKS